MAASERHTGHNGYVTVGPGRTRTDAMRHAEDDGGALGIHPACDANTRLSRIPPVVQFSASSALSA